MTIQIINKRRPSNVIGDSINALTQGFIQGQGLQASRDERNLARAKYDLEMRKLERELQPVDVENDLVADPTGSGMLFSKRQGKWLNPRAQSTNINLGGMFGNLLNNEQERQPLQEDQPLIPLTSERGQEKVYSSPDEAQASGLQKGTRVPVNINGQIKIWEIE